MTELIPFSLYMQDALYGQSGYYTSSRQRFGRAGDFYTSAQVSPIFGELWAHFIAARASKEIRIVEIGPGEGELAASLLVELQKIETRPIVYAGIEISSVSRQRAQQRLQSLFGESAQPGISFEFFATVEDLLASGESAFDQAFVFANEWLDAIPCEILRMDHQHHVDRLWVGEKDESADIPPNDAGPFQGENYFSVWKSTEDDFLVQDALTRVLPLMSYCEGPYLVFESIMRTVPSIQSLIDGLHPKDIVFVDYGGYTMDTIGEDRPFGSMRAYQRHQLVDHFLDLKGEVDLTYDVDFSVVQAVLESAGYQVNIQKQGVFLVTQPFFEHTVNDRSARDPNVIQALKNLILPGGMGERFVVAHGKSNHHV